MILFYLLAILIILITIFLLFWKFIFLRDPERNIPAGSNIVAPADGKIIKILEVNQKDIEIRKGLGKIKTLTRDIAKECYLISIFMSPFNVHINRAPISGTIKSIKYSKGKFLAADSINATLSNEKNEIIIENKQLRIKVIQIAGFLARRIKCFVKENQKVNKGERIGLIDLGSQVSIILPKKVKLKANESQKTTAGETILAENR